MRIINVLCPKCDGRGGYDVTTPGELRKARRELGLSLADVAERSSLSVPYLSMVERGVRPVTEALLHVYQGLQSRPMRRLTKRATAKGRT